MGSAISDLLLQLPVSLRFLDLLTVCSFSSDLTSAWIALFLYCVSMPKRAAAFASSSKSTPTSKKRKVGKGSSVKGKSVWNSTDDWDEMVETASLSTASIATRRPRPRGLKSLSACATDAAVRGFKWVWEEGGESGGTNGTYWKREWGQLPDHLKARVRDGIYKKWGSFLTIEIIKDVCELEHDSKESKEK